MRLASTVVSSAQLSFGEVLLRLTVAGLFGSAIGLERELEGHDAGIRTHALLAVGSALFGAISVGAFGAFVGPRATNDVSFDPSRVASYVMAGIGFLGAGVILKRGENVKGLTTAASIWVVSAVGLAAGLGFWAGALVATVIATVLLLFGRFQSIAERVRLLVATQTRRRELRRRHAEADASRHPLAHYEEAPLARDPDETQLGPPDPSLPTTEAGGDTTTIRYGRRSGIPPTH
jgi:uncharacterized membrane protein YhiD involved in acid resistance